MWYMSVCLYNLCCLKFLERLKWKETSRNPTMSIKPRMKVSLSELQHIHRDSHGLCVHCTQNETTRVFLYSVTSGRSGTKPPFLRTVAHFCVSLSWLISGTCEQVFQPSDAKPQLPTLQHWDFASETTNLASPYNFSIGLKSLTVLETPENIGLLKSIFSKKYPSQQLSTFGITQNELLAYSSTF